MIKFLASVAAIYVALAAVLYISQRRLQYFPDATLVQPAAAGLADFSAQMLRTSDGERLVAWWAPPREGKPVVLYFQGNAGAPADRADRFRHLHDMGYGVLALAYRGYGGSSGSPSEPGLTADAEAAWDFVEDQGFSAARIALYGESLGTGVAVALASRRRPAVLMLEAPFTSAADIARRQYWYMPVWLLMKDQYRSSERMASLTMPVFVLHGDADTIVPIEYGRQIYAATPGPKEMMEIKGGTHVAPWTPEIWQRLDAFLKAHVKVQGVT